MSGEKQRAPVRGTEEGQVPISSPSLWVMATTEGRGGRLSAKSGQRVVSLSSVSESSAGCWTETNSVVPSGVKHGPRHFRAGRAGEEQPRAPRGPRRRCRRHRCRRRCRSRWRRRSRSTSGPWDRRRCCRASRTSRRPSRLDGIWRPAPASTDRRQHEDVPLVGARRRGRPPCPRPAAISSTIWPHLVLGARIGGDRPARACAWRSWSSPHRPGR